MHAEEAPLPWVGAGRGEGDKVDVSDGFEAGCRTGLKEFLK